ncbi:hypothetical protein [[Flexibacter] sp. ATCC 35103]|uniref:hypothetical protein n=1 Tax=[Flexibacter] sp. ATCC 35103 TaxID=1937528 RepID=UPI0009D315C9|nr:hypothetical protein [[Flexibacter] sp. ATCC 35103]OMQ13418.1 hypothetical protein BXU01_02755 [[Flexibacter] sp. ATCC 35103]
MKKIIVLTILLAYNIFYSQNENSNGYVLEYNSLKNFKYQILKPVKIKLVDNKNEIDYSKIEGLLQSYFSANNIIWAKSDYIDSSVVISRDKEHFEKIKTLDKNENYIELENIYNFNYDNNDMAYVKFSFTFSEIPFQILNFLSLIKKDERWYIYNLPNQIKISMCLTNLNNLFLGDILNPKSSNLLKNKSSRYQYIDFDLLYDNYQALNQNEKRKIEDERIWNQNVGFNYNKETINVTISNKTVQTFAFNSSLFFKYGKKDKLYNDLKVKEKYKNELISSIIPNNNDTIKLVHKLAFQLRNSKIEIVKYQLNNKFYSKLLTDSQQLDIANIDNLSEFIRIIKSENLQDILSRNSGKDFENIIAKSLGNTNGLNISNLSDLVIKDKTKLSKYLDN